MKFDMRECEMKEVDKKTSYWTLDIDDGGGGSGTERLQRVKNLWEYDWTPLYTTCPRSTFNVFYFFLTSFFLSKIILINLIRN